MFESTNQRKVDGKNETRNGLLRDICKAMHYTVTHKTEDVIQAVEVLEYFVSILADFGSKELIKYALKLILEVLKGDFVIKGERPFKSFYWVIFYLSNGFKKLETILHEIWLPKEIRAFRKWKGNNEIQNLNVTTQDDIGIKEFESMKDVIKVQITEENEQTFTNSAKEIEDSPMKLSKKIKTNPQNVKLDWEFFDAVNTIMEYTNVVLNDLEIFQTPEIYSTFLRSYHHHLPERVVDNMMNTIYKITIDKNHRISNRRYNAMFSKDLIKTFNNVLSLYCLNVVSTDKLMQQKHFSLFLKLIYHNILLVNDKTLVSPNFESELDSNKDVTSYFQMNRANGITKDRHTNRNIKTILLQNPSIFDDLQLCFVKITQNSQKLGEEAYQERMIQIIFLYVYMLIAWKDQTEIEPVEVIIQTKDYLFKHKETVKYGMLFFMLIFSDRYNKTSIDFKKAFINSVEGVDSLVLKLHESEDEEQLMRNLYLVWLICLESPKEMKIKVISKIKPLILFNRIKIPSLSPESQKTLMSFLIEMCCLSNELLYFPIQDKLVLKDMFSFREMKYIKETIDNVFINLSEYLYKDDEDEIYYTENDFLSASQANFCAYMEDDEEHTVREAFAFIESDFLNCMFIALFQLDKNIQIEFLTSFIQLIEPKNECRRVISKMEILEFFLRVYQYHRDRFSNDPNSENYAHEWELLNLLLKLVSFSLENGIPIDDDMYLYSLLKGGKTGKIDEKLLIMLCRQVEYCDIPNNINFKETQDSFGLAAFVSKGKALQKVEKEVCLSPYISNLPSRKKGFCISFWFRLKKVYDNMNIISIWDFKGEKVLKISLSIVREFENVDIQDRLGVSNLLTNFEGAFSNPKIKKLLEVKFTRDEVYEKESVLLPFDIETDKVYHFYFW